MLEGLKTEGPAKSFIGGDVEAAQHVSGREINMICAYKPSIKGALVSW